VLSLTVLPKLLHTGSLQRSQCKIENSANSVNDIADERSYSEVLSKWRVLLLVRSLEHGGIERDAAKIAVGLDRNRFEPHVGVFIEGGFRAPELRAAGVPIVILPVRSLIGASAIHGAQNLGAYVREHGIQLLHAFDVPTDLFGAPAARWHRVPVVVTSQLSLRDFYPRQARILLRCTDWLSDAVVVNSRAAGDSLKRQIGFPTKKLYLSYNGVDARHFHPGSPVRPPALMEASLVVGSVCVIRQEKRLDWIMRSFAQVRQIHPGIHLLFVGSGPEVPRLMELRDRLGLMEVCHFEPAQAEVLPWMQSIDIYINSSSSESFPNALLEAMACGCCVIGSKVGGIPELITHLENGLLFDSGNPAQLPEMLSLAVTNAALRQKLREQAVRTAHERFSMKVALQRIEALYTKLLEQRCGRDSSSAC
jgi:L-malate glycosyltransferase